MSPRLWFEPDSNSEHPPEPSFAGPDEQKKAKRLCAEVGHDDVTRTRPIKAAPMVQCLRCGRVGWRVPAA